MGTKIDPRRLAEAIKRSNLREFAKAAFEILMPGERLEWNWHLDAICHQLEQVMLGKVQRLIIEVPPRSLKSFLASVIFPAFCLGRNPSSKIIAASYSLDLAGKLANDCRALLRSDFYRSLFQTTEALLNKNTETEYLTSARGYRYSTSTGGTLTGRGGEIIILDDPLKPEDAQSDAKREAAHSWLKNTVFSRLNSKKTGAIILVMQRLHIDDPAGRLREQGGWTVLSLPAIAEVEAHIELGQGRVHTRAPGDILHAAREPKHILDAIKRDIGTYNFSAQYQQEPVPPEGEIVKWGWFRFFERLPVGPRRVVQSWDIAIKPEDRHDYSVCTTWAIVGDQYYLLDLYRKRLAFPDLHRAVTDLARRWSAETLIIEDKASGTALIQQLKEKRQVGVPIPIAYLPKEDKVTRMLAETPAIEAGHVHLQADAGWHGDLKTELVQFPNGRFDDQVDSISQFLSWARGYRVPDFGLARIRR